MTLNNLPIEQASHWLVTWRFDGDEFDALARHAQEVRCPAQATIFSQGDPSHEMYLVREGMVLILTRDPLGAEKTIGIVTEGQSFGELGVLVGSTRHTTAVAGLDVTLLKITPETLTALEAEQPRLVMRMYKMLAQTLAEQWVRVGPWASSQRPVGE